MLRVVLVALAFATIAMVAALAQSGRFKVTDCEEVDEKCGAVPGLVGIGGGVISGLT
jgi:hypothetical protein